MNIEDVANAVVANAKTGKWLSCTFQVDNGQAVGGRISVGVKAFGKWVQRIECCGLVSGANETRTLKALKAGVIEGLNAMIGKL